MIDANHPLFARPTALYSPSNYCTPYVHEEHVNCIPYVNALSYLMEASMEHSLHLIIIKCGSLDVPTGILVIKRYCLAGS